MQRNTGQVFYNNPTLTSLSVALKLWSRLSQINVRCKQEQSTKHKEGVKWLHESCTVFRSIQFNQPDFDKTIIFVFCTKRTSQSPLSHAPFCLCAWLEALQHLVVLYDTDCPSPHFPLPCSASRLPHITGFDSMWMMSLREALAPYRVFFC